MGQALADDHQTCQRFEAFAASRGIRNLSDAYTVQREYVRIRRALSGSAAVGYKIGLTSEPMQAMCGIDSPVSGVITADGVFTSPARIDGARYGRLGLEFEIAVRIGRDLRPNGRQISVSDAADSVDGVCAAIELVDDRSCDYATLDVLSLVADNAWNAGIVRGVFERRWPDLADVQGIALADGVEIGRGVGRDVLGHPFVPLAWLANHLAREERFLSAGDIVMTGSLIRTQFPAESTQYSYSVSGLGTVSCHVTLPEPTRSATQRS